ncbi:Os11g0429433 [Oryza sativa Japonica Group]|jgi:hypothetical protein|uniref:Os11g0429433 protein n=1 Tax=Oryza sativa subsp. japonica TaxID=39947 RepID=A0A0P0Y1Z8_ORYSJ|nr:hypothetical protein EE612_055163 [Oryza sativa]KAF2910653.1 hypothetical protein DAI22_11g117200 [Oryza sativa Japonica Group]BAT13811.1 Os11g0429433 [Oryza sativa Japonica Group]
MGRGQQPASKAEVRFVGASKVESQTLRSDLSITSSCNANFVFIGMGLISSMDPSALTIIELVWIRVQFVWIRV